MAVWCLSSCVQYNRLSSALTPVRPLGLDFNDLNKVRVVFNECIVSNYRTLKSLTANGLPSEKE